MKLLSVKRIKLVETDTKRKDTTVKLSGSSGKYLFTLLL